LDTKNSTQNVDNLPMIMIALALCTTVAVSTDIANSFAVGVATLFVLILSNFVMSVLRKWLPHNNNARVLLHIIVVATFATVVQMFLQSYLSTVYDNLGMDMPAITIKIALGCLIMGGLVDNFVAIPSSMPKHTLRAVYLGLVFLLLNVLLGTIRQIISSIGFAFFDSAMGGYLVLAFVLCITYAVMATQNKQCVLYTDQLTV